MEQTYRGDDAEARDSEAPPSPRRGVPRGDRARIEEDRELLIRYQRHGDERAREELLARFMPLARQLARRYERANEPLDDLLQVANIGLVKAIGRCFQTPAGHAAACTPCGTCSPPPANPNGP